MVSETLQERVKALESRVKELEAEVRQRSLDAAYVYIHSNWTLIRWYLDRTGALLRSVPAVLRIYGPRDSTMPPTW